MQIAAQEIRIEGALVRIARPAADLYDSVRDPAALIDALRAAPARVDLFTFVQTLPDTTPNYPYPMEWDNVAAVSISTFEHWWTQQINTNARKALRIAEQRGIAVREVPFDDALVQGMSCVYNERPVRQGRRYRHYGKNVERVRRENATFLERSIFIGAFHADEMVGFAKLVCDEQRRQAGLMQIVSMVRHWDKAPTKALIAQAVRSCAERQIGYLLFANYTYGKKPDDSLADFKQRNGFRRVDVPRYYVPLTRWGHTALRLGLHHRFASLLPEPLLARLRTARRRWYERRLGVAEMNAR